jgi:hypothetical protein
LIGFKFSSIIYISKETSTFTHHYAQWIAVIYHYSVCTAFYDVRALFHGKIMDRNCQEVMYGTDIIALQPTQKIRWLEFIVNMHALFKA